jgi:hypothetical protein
VAGSWWKLKTIYDQAVQYQIQRWQNPLPDCPECGEPLSLGPDGIRFCRYSGWRETQRQRND